MDQIRSYAVLTSDIEKSRDIENFPNQRDQRLEPLVKSHLANGLIISRYAITAWDEFEGIAADLVHVPEILLDLRRTFFPMRLRIGIGIGEVTDPSRTPVNAFVGGIAFERARKALKLLDAERKTLARSTLIVSENTEFDEIANTVYQLHDVLINRISAKQWLTINTQLEEESQDLTARRLGVDKSMVSRRLRRGNYWELLATKRAVQTLIRHCWDRRQ